VAQLPHLPKAGRYGAPSKVGGQGTATLVLIPTSAKNGQIWGTVEGRRTRNRDTGPNSHICQKRADMGHRRRSEDKVPRHWSYSHICQKRADMGHRRTSAKNGQIWGTKPLAYESCNEPSGSCIIRAELSPGFNNPAGGARWASHHGSAPAEANGSFQHPRSAALRN